MQAGIYPYFRAIESEQDTVVVINGRKVLMFGDEELACGEITVRDMATKEQTKVKIGNIVNYLQGEKT